MLETFKRAHYEQLVEWCKGHNEPITPFALLPSIGFIVPGVACGFLICTDSVYAVIDNFISNPNCSVEVRSQALDAITEALESEASKYGFSNTVTFTNIPAIQKRALKHGYIDSGQYHFLFKRIS